MNSPALVIAYLVIMMLIAAVEATSRQIRTYPGHFLDSLAAVILGGGVVGAFGAIVIFNPNPWWKPSIMVSGLRGKDWRTEEELSSHAVPCS
jgi:ABC-type iron transport system FetAB permease component